MRERAVMEGGELVVEGAVAANLVPDGAYELAVRGANANAAFSPLGLVPLRIARTR